MKRDKISMKYIYSAVNNAFYPLELQAEYKLAETWPIDGIEVDKSVFDEFSYNLPDNKIRSADKNGLPCWGDIPPPSNEELRIAYETKKQYLIEIATIAIAPLQDAVDLDIATDEEITLLKEWKKYRVLLNRIDTNDINSVFPEAPTDN